MGSFQQNIEFMWAWMMAGGTAFAGKSMHNADEDTELKEMKRNEVEVTQSLVPLEEAIGPARHRPRLFQQRSQTITAPGLTLENIQTIENPLVKRVYDNMIGEIQSIEPVNDANKKRELLTPWLLAHDSRLAQAMLYSPVIDQFFKDPVLDDLWKERLDNKPYQDHVSTHNAEHCQQWFRCYLNHELSQWNKDSWKNHPAITSLQTLCDRLNSEVIESPSLTF